MNTKANKFLQAQIEHRNTRYKVNRQVMRDLKVTPLRIPYDVKHEVCGEL